MYQHYLLPALKRILRHRLYSAISILSLAIGMTAGILIFTFVQYETSFDSMHPDNERVYRVNWADVNAGSRFATFFNPLTPLLTEGLPEVEQFTRLAMREHLFTVGNVDQLATLSFVDDEFFSFFSYPSRAGDATATVVRDAASAGSAVLTEAAAVRLFGTTDAAGKIFTVDGAHDFRVGAVVANNPANSHLGSNIFINIDNLPTLWRDPDILSRYGSDLMYHYVRLSPGSDPVAVAQNAMTYLSVNLGLATENIALMLQPLREIHFTANLQNEMAVVDDMLGTVKSLRQPTDIRVFSAVALLTLLIASLNFMNMRTVQFAKQAREAGIRRICGASRSALTAQLLIETALMSLLALLLAIVLCELLLPWFGSVLGVSLMSGLFLSFPGIAILALLAMMLGVTAGLYPAWTAARLAPVAALRGQMDSGRRGASLRALLIVLQFTISIGLIVGSVVVRQQIEFAFDKPPGFEPGNVVSIELPNNAARNAVMTMRDELLTSSGVASVSAGTTVPTRSLSDGMAAVRAGGDPNAPLITRVVGVSEDYFTVLGMEFVAGRALSERFATDKKPPLSLQRRTARGGMVLNETAARLAGWSNPADAVGSEFQDFPIDGDTRRNDYTVVGIVADAHFGSIRREVEPVSYIFSERYSPNVLLIRLAGETRETTLADITRVWREHVPDYPIQLSFLEDTWTALYAGEERTFALFIVLAALAVMIACSGLYGLASWITERRTREIGVRKVMGGGVWSIVLLLTNDFSKLVLLSNVIAWPVAYFAMNRWLENFAYRIDLTPVVFIGSGLIALCIAWVTVGGTAAKAASAKPVLALRYE